MRIDVKIEGQTSEYQSLFEVYVNDFGDNYHRLDSEPSSEFERRVRRIKRRYKDLSEYDQALTDYNDWMDYLAGKYGGHRALEQLIKFDLVKDYVPHKPKLKDKKRLKFLYENNIMVNNVKQEFDVERMNEYLERNYPNDSDEEVEVIYNKKNKEVNTIIDEYTSSLTYKKSLSSKSDIDFIDEYFRLKNSGKKKKGKDKNKPYRAGLKDLMSGEYLKYMDDEDDDSIVMFNGRYMDSKTARELQIYHNLADYGWNSYKLMKKSNFSKNVSRMFKKEKKKKKNKKKADSVMYDIMSDNGYDDFASFVEDMTNMSYDNIFK